MSTVSMQVDDLLEKARRAMSLGDRRAAGILLRQALKLDFTNPGVWQLLHGLLAADQPLESFQREFAQKYFPDKAYLIAPASAKDTETAIPLTNSSPSIDTQVGASPTTVQQQPDLAGISTERQSSPRSSQQKRTPWGRVAILGLGCGLLILLCLAVSRLLQLWTTHHGNPDAIRPVVSTKKSTSKKSTFTPTAIPSPNPISLKAYDYSTHDCGNGWCQGEFKLILENRSSEYVLYKGNKIFNSSDWDNAYVETQEGKTYPVETQVAPSCNIEGKNLVIPPRYRIVQFVNSCVNRVYFKFAEAAHPVRVVFPERPDLTVNLADINQLEVYQPLSTTGLRSIDSIKDKVLSEKPGVERFVLNGVSSYRDMYGMNIKTYMYTTATNLNLLDETVVMAVTMNLEVITPYGEIGETVLPWLNTFDLGPGQEYQDASSFIVDSRVSDTDTFYVVIFWPDDSYEVFTAHVNE